MSRNVVVVCLDTVRKDYFEEYAPRLSDQSDASFQQCRAASSWTTPSHGSMFTGELPHQHGVHSHQRRFDDIDPEDTFLGDLPEEYTTIGVSANVHAGPAFGFDHLFDRFTYLSGDDWYEAGMDPKTFLNESESDGLAQYVEWIRESLNHEHTIKSVLNGVGRKADTLRRELPVPRFGDDGTTDALAACRDHIEAVDGPFVLFVNLMEAHTPHEDTWAYDSSLYDVPSQWSSVGMDYWPVRRDGPTEEHSTEIGYFEGLYRASIDYLDRTVSDFVASLPAETTTVVTADHGEDLGGTTEEPLFGHVGSLSEGLLHVPLELIDPPEGYEETVTGYVSHLDLGRLVTGIADGENPAIERETVPAEVVGGLLADGDWPISEAEFEYWDRMIRCVYEGTTKYQWDSQGGTYEYEVDPDRPSTQERVAEGVEIPESCLALFEHDIAAFKERARTGGGIGAEADPETRDRLEELGYL